LKVTLCRQNREPRYLNDIVATYGDSESLRLEASAMTVGTNTSRHVAFDFFAYHLAVGLLVTAVEIWNDALEVDVITAGMPVLWCITNGQLIRCAKEYSFALLIRQLAPGRIQAEIILFRQGIKDR
jgi:hypothetical protein